MNNRHWLALSAGMVAILLLVYGGIAAWTIAAVQQVEAVPGTPFATAEDVAWAKSYLPELYFLATEGLLFGVIGVVAALGLVWEAPWARSTLLFASVLLALIAVVAVFVAPRQWDMQMMFVLFCVLLWWWRKKEKRSEPTAL